MKASSDFRPKTYRLMASTFCSHSNAANGYEEYRLLLEVATKKIEWLTRDKWEIRGAEFSPDGKHITFSANVDGNEDIFLYDLAIGKSIALAVPKGVNEPVGGHSAFAADGSRLLYMHNGPTAPAISGSIT